ncbi:hypothetical protein [Streptomyces vinaceus]|uniref:hypothetical protein n=1 Tax=Streptomyces vinaceus TaxID=1960 RepID=UPI0036777C3F
MPRRTAPKQGAEADDAPGVGGHGGECDHRTGGAGVMVPGDQCGDTGCAYGYPDGGW